MELLKGQPMKISRYLYKPLEFTKNFNFRYFNQVPMSLWCHFRDKIKQRITMDLPVVCIHKALAYVIISIYVFFSFTLCNIKD